MMSGNQKLIGLTYKFSKQYQDYIVKEGEQLFASQMGRQRRPSDSSQDETDPTSFNFEGACDVFKEIFKHLLANASKNLKK